MEERLQEKAASLCMGALVREWETLGEGMGTLEEGLGDTYEGVGDREVWGTLGEGVWDTLEKAMAPHSSTLSWKIPWTEEPGRLQFMGSRRVGHN